MTPANLPLDGNSTSTVEVHVARASGAAVGAVAVALHVDGCQVTPAAAEADATGLAHLGLSRCVGGLHTVKAVASQGAFSAALAPVQYVNSYTPVPGDAARAPVAVGTPLVLSFAGLGVRRVQFIASDPQATVSPPLTLKAADHGGVAIPQGLVFNTPGLQTVQAVDTVTQQVLAVQSFWVAAGGPRTLALEAPTSVVVGEAISLQVTVQDAPGHTDTEFTGLLHLSSSDPLATLAADVTLTPADAGQRTLTGIRLASSGAQTLTVSATGAQASTPGSAEVAVMPVPVVGFTVSGAGSLTAGVAAPITLTAVDAHGGRVSAYSGMVQLSSSDTQAVLPTVLPLTDGQATAAVTFFTSGAQYLQAVDLQQPGLRGAAGNLLVAPGTPASIALTVPAQIAAGATLEVGVTVQDAFGNTAVGFAGTVQLSSSDAVVLPPTAQPFDTHAPAALTVTAGQVRTAGLLQVTASDDADALVPDQQVVEILSGAATHLDVHTRDPSPLLQAGAVTVTARDAFENLVPSYTGVVHLTSSDANAALPADVVMDANSRGSATVMPGVAFGTVGVQTLTATDANQRLSGNQTGIVVHTPKQVTTRYNALFACVLMSDGRVQCWGDNIFGQLGVGDTAQRGSKPGQMGAALPYVDLGTGRTAKQVVAATLSACALLDTQQVKCWGHNNAGQLGLGDDVQRGSDANQMGDALPVVQLGTGRTATQLAAASNDFCAILDDASVKCWGKNGSGELGLGDTLPRGLSATDMGDGLSPIDLGPGTQARHIAGLSDSFCAVLADGSLKCWGNNNYGQLGLQDTAARGRAPNQMGNNLPGVALGTGRTATNVYPGELHTCASLDDGTLKCWGFNNVGNLGLGDTQQRGSSAGTMGNALPAVQLGTGRSAKRYAGNFVMGCAILDDASLKCWGQAILGYGDTFLRGSGPNQMGDNLPPLALGAGRTAIDVTSGTDFSCVLLDNGQANCWGHNDYGMLGMGDTTSRMTLPSPNVQW